MTKDELRAENERLGAEIAALRELVTVIGAAMPPAPADPGSSRDREEHAWLIRERLSSVATIARCAMDYAASASFTPVVRNSAGTLRKVLAEPLPYQAKGAKAAAQDPAPGPSVSERARRGAANSGWEPVAQDPAPASVAS